jgi:D-ribitol-5-phosphate cytidylyltransferase
MHVNACILLAGGTGVRTGLKTPKQFIMIEGKPLFCYSAEEIGRCPGIDAIIIVTLAGWEKYVQEWVKKLNIGKAKYIVNEGVTRHYSILNGLEKAREFMDRSGIIMIHDSARPMISQTVMKNALEKAAAEGSALPVIQLNDMLYFSDDGKYINRAMPKSCVYTGQTPVCFNFGMYYDLAAGTNDEEAIKSSSSCTLLFKNGIRVASVPGDPDTFKITCKEDIDLFKKRLIQKKQRSVRV